ncbi:uncharacterized protein ACB058_015672 isoform 1-T1 [Synchiropus picturatus]
MNYTTKVVQVTNVSPATTSEQMRTLFGFLGTIEELKLFPPDDSTMPVTSRVCFVKFHEPESVGVSQHLTNTVFVDRALIVVPFAEGSIPDEAKALSLLAPANAVAGILPGAGLLPTPNPLPSPAMGGNPFAGLSMDAMAAFGFPGANMNAQTADLLKLMTDPKLNPLAAGLNLNAGLKPDAATKEIEEAMKRVREAQSLISAAIEPGSKESRGKRSRSRSRRRRSRSRSRHRRSNSRSRRRSSSRSRRRSKSPRRRREPSRERGRRSRSRSRKKEESSRRKSKTPPKSYSTARRSSSASRRRRKSRSASRSPKKSPKRRSSRSPSPRRHKKEKKREKERERRSEKERGREERERSSSKKKKSKDKDRERERKSDGDKGDSKITRDYDEEEQGYNSEQERDRKYGEESAFSPEGNGKPRSKRQAKVNGEEHRQEDDMEVSD